MRIIDHYGFTNNSDYGFYSHPKKSFASLLVEISTLKIAQIRGSHISSSTARRGPAKCLQHHARWSAGDRAALWTTGDLVTFLPFQSANMELWPTQYINEPSPWASNIRFATLIYHNLPY